MNVFLFFLLFYLKIQYESNKRIDKLYKKFSVRVLIMYTFFKKNTISAYFTIIFFKKKSLKLYENETVSKYYCMKSKNVFF